MPRTCTVCTHPDRKAIDSALVAGESARSIVARYGTIGRTIGRMAVQRHAVEHLPATMTKAKEAKEEAHADNLLGQVKELQGKATQLLLAAEKQGDFRTALAGIREARGCVELLAKLLGELDESPTINVTISPQWLSIRAVIVEALADHPAARLRVAEALAALEQA
jgi:hypothetical protein